MVMCSDCGLFQKLSYHYYCRDCHNKHSREFYKRNPLSRKRNPKKNKEYRDKYAVKIKDLIRDSKRKPCEDCGIEYPWYVMDYDHVRGKKKFRLSSATKRQGLKIVKEEIAKCDVVCSNCHRERTHNRTGIGT